jgi:hypothetical protein
MSATKIIHFVCFETTLKTDLFITQWERFNRSADSDIDVTLQQSEKNGTYRYIAQHRCPSGEFKFTFSKNNKASRTPEVGIKARQAGGYSLLLNGRKEDAAEGEEKVFTFIQDPQTDLSFYRKAAAANELNIYEAYYENCAYAYILEYFIKSSAVSALCEQLKDLTPAEIAVYKECDYQAV